MNDYDRGNLEFLLNADKETLLEWYNVVDEDDHEYASELMMLYSEELVIKNRLIDDTEILKTQDAILLLKTFRL